MSKDDRKADFPGTTTVRKTAKAMLCCIPMGKETKEVWIPQAMIHDDSEVFDDGKNSAGKLVLKLWWAEKEGLV